jgi:acyl-CoA oxidase
MECKHRGLRSREAPDLRGFESARILLRAGRERASAVAALRLFPRDFMEDRAERVERHDDAGAASYVRGAGYTGELQRLLSGDLSLGHVQAMRELLRDELFKRREGLTDAQAGSLAYARASFVARALRLEGQELRRDPRMLYALHEWISISDAACTTILSIHYCLALGSLIEHGQGREDLAEFVAELERMDSVGVFLATELGYGNNVQALETRAVYRPETLDFVLDSPSPSSSKFMPNTAIPVPKLAIVMARLISRDRDCGVFPFLVRVRERDGSACAGVHIVPLTEKAAYALDNGMTRFDSVRIPKHHLLAGEESVLNADGSFRSTIPSRRQRFLSAMDRVQTGRVCFTSGAVALLRAATWIATRYASQRLTSAPGRRSVPILRYRNVQAEVFGALASAYALTFAVRYLQRQFRARTPETKKETFRLVAALKAVLTSEASDGLSRLRERCGAAGMLSANRIVEYWNQLQGVITAEGDNQLMLLKVGRQLWDAGPSASSELPPELGELSSAEPEDFVDLFRFREARLVDALRANVVAALGRTRDSFAVWNDNVNGTIAAATAYGIRVIAECFAAAVRGAQDVQAARQLRLLFALWSMAQMERHAGWFMAQSALTASAVNALPRTVNGLCADLEPHALELVDAFGFDNTELQAPIASDDYVAAYHARFASG